MCGSICGEKQFLLILILYNWFVQKQLFKQILIFRRICLFSNIVPVFEIVTFLTKKRSPLWITSKCYKTTVRHILAVRGSLCGEKQFLLIFIPFYRFVQNLFKQIQIFLRICPFSNMVRKINFLSISVLVSEIVTFLCLKRKFLYEFLQKSFKTTERHSLVVCGSLCGEKQFLLIFILYNWFVPKQLFKQILIFLRICLFSNIMLVYGIFTFLTKKRSSLWITAKCFKTTERHSLEVRGSFCGEKKFLLIFIPFYKFVQNLFKQI